MTARERVERTFSFERPDRVACHDLLQNIPLVERLTGEAVTPENYLDLTCRACRHLDMTRGISGKVQPFQEQGKYTWNGFVIATEWWTSWIVERPFKTPDELAEYIKMEIDQLSDWRTGEAWDWWGKRVEPQYLEEFQTIQERMGDTVLMLAESPVAVDVAWHRASHDLFWPLYQEKPDLISTWLDAMIDHELKRIHDIADPRLSTVVEVAADIAYRSGTIASPAWLRKEFFPRLRRIVDAWHQHGLRVVFHSDGNLWAVMDDLVSAGIDGLNPLERLAGMDPVLVRERYPSLVLVGGIDASQLLPFGTAAEVEAEVKRIVEAVAPTGGLFIGSSTEVHPGCDVENVIAMLESAKRYGSYSRVAWQGYRP